ncbi:Uncharacterised protein [Vibrio cholerae]|nr:Uncharacterised protein [Vibrio cholerae]
MVTNSCELCWARTALCDRVYSSLWLVCAINHRIDAYNDSVSLILLVAMCMI